MLVADDNPVNRLIARRLLEQRGCPVTEAADGAEAVAAHALGLHDLALLDLRMPRMGGLEAAHRLLKAARLSSSRLHLVAVTAGTSPDERLACERAGFDQVLSKPLRAEDLDRILAGLAPAPDAALPSV